MTHPDILQAERAGHPSPFQPEGPALACSDCLGEIHEGELYSGIGICESCEDSYTWTHDPDTGDEPIVCAGCGEGIEASRMYVSLPNGDGDFCLACFEETKTTAWAA